MSGCGVHGQCKITSVDWGWSCCLDSLNESYRSFILSRLWKSVYAKASAYILLNSEQLHRSADLSLYTKKNLSSKWFFPHTAPPQSYGSHTCQISLTIHIFLFSRWGKVCSWRQMQTELFLFIPFVCPLLLFCITGIQAECNHQNYNLSWNGLSIPMY